MTVARVRLASGIELEIDDCGAADAPALIFLHGFPENRHTWRQQIAHLSAHYRCIAPDQRGYGASSKPAGVAAYAPQALVGDVFQLADALGIARFTVVGHDWGGALAWAVAAWGQIDGRVERLVVANAPHLDLFQRLLYLDPHQRRASQYVRMFRNPAVDGAVHRSGLAPLLARAFGAALPGDSWRTRLRQRWQALNMALTMLRRLPAADRSERRRQWADPATAMAMLNWYRASPLVVPPMDAPYALPAGHAADPAQVTIPTLVIWAMDDIALPAINLDGLDAVVSDLRIVRVPHCGHFVPWEAPAAVNAALSAFLAETGP